MQANPKVIILKLVEGKCEDCHKKRVYKYMQMFETVQAK